MRETVQTIFLTVIEWWKDLVSYISVTRQQHAGFVVVEDFQKFNSLP